MEFVYTRVIINNFIIATNNFAADTNRPRWQVLGTEEFYVFLTLVVWFGINRLPDRWLAWGHGNNPFNSYFVNMCMTRNRFNNIIMTCYGRATYA